MNEVENKNIENNKEEKYLQFSLGGEKYAIELLKVKEVIPNPETTPVPNTPSYHKGIMNLRGQIISVVDLRSKLGIKPDTENLEEAVVIVDFEGLAIGLIVDSINHVLNTTVGEITEVPELSTQINTAFIQGVYKKDDSLVMFLDIEKILNISEIKKFAKSA